MRNVIKYVLPLTGIGGMLTAVSLSQMNALLSHIERLRPRIVAGVCVCCLGVIAAREASALQDTTYSSALDDRFSSGYPNTPVNNASASFLGAGYDFSGVGWSSADPTKSFGLLSPRHYLVARHYSGAATLSFFGDDGQVHSYSQQSVEDTNYGIVFSGQTVGDISMGTLTTSVAASNQIQPFSILDLGSYTNQTVMLYGHGPDGSSSPRVGETTISNVTTGIGANLNSYFETPRTQTQLEGGDSGSPAFIPWTDPTGAKQLTIIGNNAGVGTTNYLNFLGRQEVITALNGLMANEGYALRFVADATATWVGGGSGSPSQKNVFSQSSNWSGQAPSATGYLAFDADTTSYLSVSLGSATQNSRGLIFNPGSTGFTLSSGTLSLGRGGINNYDVHRQTFSNGFTLADSQYWDGRSGGLTVTGAVNTNGKLLIVEGSARNSLSGGISGSGSLAKDGSGVLALSGSNNYTGPTFLHNGVLLADNSAGSATGTGFVTVETGTLAGFGVISGSAIVATGAHVTAGDIVSGTVPTLDPALQANNNLTFGGT